jgi:hypothetical protein
MEGGRGGSAALLLVRWSSTASEALESQVYREERDRTHDIPRSAFVWLHPPPIAALDLEDINQRTTKPISCHSYQSKCR